LARAALRLAVEQPRIGPRQAALFDEQTLPLHAACLAAVSISKFG
jgi:hypothetical protein